MDAYQRLGKWIAGHMTLLIPFCLLGGIFLPQAFVPLRPLVTPMFAFMTFQGALGNDFDSLGKTLRRPQALIAALMVTHVVMPLIAFMAGSVFYGSDPDLVCGIVLEYSVPVAVVSIMWTGIYEGNVVLALAALFVSTMLAPFSIPFTLRLLLGKSVQMDALAMMGDMVVHIALPALLGTLLNHLSHGWGKRELSPAIMPLSRVFLVLIITINSTGVSSFMRSLTPRLVGVIALIGTLSTSSFLVAIAVSRVLGLDRGDALATAFCGGLRNISAGAVIAVEYFPPEVLFPVMMGTLFQQYLAATMGKLIPRLVGTTDGTGEA